MLKASHFWRALDICGAVVILVGCGGSQLAPLGRGQQNAATTAFKAVQSGSIVYTPVNKTIGKHGKLELNLDNHGTNDFTFVQWYSQYYEDIGMLGPRLCGAAGGLLVTPNHNRDGIENGATVGWAAELSYGSPIDSNVRFDHAKSLMYDFAMGCTGRVPPHHNGYWNGASNMYLGLELKIHGQTHYGWARLSTGGSLYGISTTLTGYAYETAPGIAIDAGQTQ